MKLIVPFALFIAAGFILAAGCVAPTNNGTVNATTPITFAPITNTSDTGLNKTINATTNNASEPKGSLKVSISGISFPENLSVVLDNETVGTVNPTTPLYLMVSEGNHTVMVCKNSVCKQENVTTRFGMYVTADFSNQLQKDVEFPNPTARILNYYKNGNIIFVNVEFINPSAKDFLMSVELSCRYTYIDDRTLIKIEDTSIDISEQYVNAGERITEWQNLYLGTDNILNYDRPVIKELKIK
jgi:hypothetical protein